MSGLFLKLLNMSISASVLIVVVVLDVYKRQIKTGHPHCD